MPYQHPPQHTCWANPQNDSWQSTSAALFQPPGTRRSCKYSTTHQTTTHLTLLLDPHLNLAPAHFVTVWNHLALYLASARLATFHTHLTATEHSSANIILLTATQPLDPDTLHNLIHTVATHCGVAQPLHLLHPAALRARPDGTPSPSSHSPPSPNLYCTKTVRQMLVSPRPEPMLYSYQQKTPAR